MDYSTYNIVFGYYQPLTQKPLMTSHILYELLCLLGSLSSNCHLVSTLCQALGTKMSKELDVYKGEGWKTHYNSDFILW